MQIQTPIAFRAILQEELAPVLTRHQKELLALVGITDFLACMTVVNRERAAGRLAFSPAKADEAARLMRALGISCRRSEFDMRTQRSLVGGTLHQGSLVPRDTCSGAEAVLHFSLDEEIAEQLDIVEINNQHALLGSLFGYPTCCTRKFTEVAGAELDKTARCVPGVGPFPKALNPIFRYLYGLNLLFHFPCSPDCEASLKMHHQRRQYLRSLSTVIDDYDTLAVGLALYGSQVGIALASEYRQVDEHTYLLQKVITRNPRAAERLRENGGGTRIRLRSQHTFRIGGVVVENDPQQFAALFV